MWRFEGRASMCVLAPAITCDHESNLPLCAAKAPKRVARKLARDSEVFSYGAYRNEIEKAYHLISAINAARKMAYQ